MLTNSQVFKCVQEGNWFTLINLKGVLSCPDHSCSQKIYVPIIPAHRKYLCFSFHRILYRYNGLPLGYTLVLRTFSRCVDMALQPLCSAEMRVLFYLDNLLLLASSRQEVTAQTEKLTAHLSMLDFSLNWEKGYVVPANT